MRILGRRASWNLWPLRINWSGLRPTSLTLDLILWRGVLWERKRRRR
jgi:hypothetical protein